ncbi:MAG: hypothetical protein ACRD3L_06800 [Terriglobales bacterium]
MSNATEVLITLYFLPPVLATGWGWAVWKLFATKKEKFVFAGIFLALSAIPFYFLYPTLCVMVFPGLR